MVGNVDIDVGFFVFLFGVGDEIVFEVVVGVGGDVMCCFFM